MLIFLAGVHGVGKSFLAERTKTKHGFVHKTASELIREERGRASWSADRLVSEIDENQQALIAAVGRRRQLEESLLLDGHFVLRDAQGVLTRIAIDVFAQLHVTKTVLLEAPVEVIQERLASRSGGQMGEGVVRELQTAEHEHAVQVCSRLGIPLTILNEPTEAEFSQALASLR